MNSRSDSLTSLLVSRNDAIQKIEAQIEKGYELKNSNIKSYDDLTATKALFRSWDKYNGELLRRLFSDDSLANEYNFVGMTFLSWQRPPLNEAIAELRHDVNVHIGRLESILPRLELMSEPDGDHTPTDHEVVMGAGIREVFIVHGHDNEVRQSVARFIEKLSLHAIILDEQPSKGRTIIEKFEDESINAGFAVVLLTPDDVGTAKSQSDMQARARQNVLFELGYFTGKLGRGRVCLLRKGDVEIPSDLAGIVYISIDENDGWKLQLAREMKEADLNGNWDKVI